MDGGGTRRGMWGYVGPKKTGEKERERGWRVRVGEEEEEERPRRKAGKAAGMDGDRSGYLKGKVTPGHPRLPAALRVLGWARLMG